MSARHPDWATVFDRMPENELPWHFESLDPDLEAALKQRGIKSGSMLDIGCGNGVQAELLARAGFNVLGIDISQSAIKIAEKRAAANLQFQLLNIVAAPSPKRFDYAFDRGCFHVLEVEDRAAFVRNVHQSLADHGILFLKCFSAEEPDRGFGPLRFTLAEITKEFTGFFKVADCEVTVFQGTKPHKPKSLFVTLQKI